MFSGFEVIKSFNIEEKTKEDFQASNYNVENRKYRFGIFESFTNHLSLMLGMLVFFAPLGLGTYLTIIGKFTVGGMLASVQLTNYIANPLMNLSNIIGKIKGAKPINEKLEAIIRELNGDDSGEYKGHFTDSIEFKNVSFSYNEERRILNDVSLKINKGEKVAIVGKSGSGKSSLLRLLLRYYDGYEGTITMDDADIKGISLSSIYNMISIIQQDVFMFDDDITSNIALYGDYGQDEIDTAIELSCLWELVARLPQGKNSPVGENGCNLSGGEKQRISIARALVKKTQIILLDEATGSLDSKTAYDIESSLLDIEDLTSIVVTHKLSEDLLKRYDKIVALDGGRVVEVGTFRELIDRGEYFYSLYNVERAA